MSRRRNRKLILAVALALAGTLLAQSAPGQHVIDRTAQQAANLQPGSYQVTHVSDGDTFTVSMDGHPEKVRLIGVDTPETVKPEAPVQCFGPEASAHSKQLLHGMAVRLEADPTNSNRDRYQRLLRYAYLPDGTLLNQQLIAEGYGFAYLSFGFQKQAEFAAAQARARDGRKGLWAVCQPQLNGGRWRSNDLLR